MRHLTLALALAFAAPASADTLHAGPNSLSGVLKWLPSKAQGGEDLALVAGDQTLRFWAGGKVEGPELEKCIGKSVTIEGTVHEYTGAWFIAPDKLTAQAASEATTAAAPKAPVTSPPQRASDLASQWFLEQHKGKKLEPVVRVKKLEGNVADVLVTGQSEDGEFSEAVKLSVDVDRGTVARQE